MNQSHNTIARAGGRLAGAAGSAAVLAGLACASPGTAVSQPGPAGARPNIVLFLVDDMGWRDTTVLGSQYYETPNMERLAAEGMLFTAAYSANPLCSPTRASIMTGKWPARLNFTAASGHTAPNPDAPPIGTTAPPDRKVVIPNSRNQLALEEYTVAEALRDAGYATAFIGKWHLGRDEVYHPLNQGFDINIAGGAYPGPPSYFSPYGIHSLEDGPEGEHITDRLTDEAIAYMSGRADETDPFFLCLWHYSVHGPWQYKEELIGKYRGKTDPLGYQDSTIMGSMLESMDQSLGRMLDAISDLGIEEDTVFIFYSDNGGNVHTDLSDPVTGASFKPTNNAPLSFGKAHIREGGQRVPAMVRWPGVVDGGRESGLLVSTVDLYPTIVEWAGAATQPGQVIDGQSLVGYLRDGTPPPRDAVFNHFPHYVPATGNIPATSMHQGDWKLIRYYGEGATNREDFHELFNLADDIGETNNLADAMPEKLAEMSALLDQWLVDSEAVVPIPNPNYRQDPVDGWEVLQNVSMEERQGFLRLAATAPASNIINNDVGPYGDGPFRIEIRQRSGPENEGEQSEIMWGNSDGGPSVAAGRGVRYDVAHDGTWHVYSFDISSGDIRALRFDPLQSIPGVVDVDYFRLYRAAPGRSEELVRGWEFGGEPTDESAVGEWRSLEDARG